MARYWVIVAQLNSWYMKKEETNNLDSIWIDVVKAIDNIKNNHSEKAKQLIESINEINMALKSGERDRIMYTNFLICSRFPEIIFAQNSGIIEVSKEAMESQALLVQSDSLKAIGILLYKAILAEKTLQVSQEAGKIAIKQAMRNFFGDTFGLLRP